MVIQLPSFPELSNAWRLTRIDYFDLTSVAKERKAHRKKKCRSDAEEKLRLVTRPSLEQLVLMKIVELPGAAMPHGEGDAGVLGPRRQEHRAAVPRARDGGGT
ncbi:hypothetical protein DL765_010821 [Monosporascus sp. GIB2]|nr:hypothetical protein DL765_010821 [Monosporascus sp. GIB2]